MLSRIIFAIVVAVSFTLACLLLGAILLLLKIDIATTVGDFFKLHAGTIGILAGLFTFASGFVYNRNRL